MRKKFHIDKNGANMSTKVEARLSFVVRLVGYLDWMVTLVVDLTHVLHKSMSCVKVPKMLRHV